MLRASKLNKSYSDVGRDLHVLKDIELQVQKGEMVAVMGVSGAGKTTLLNLLGGLDRPDSGAVRYNEVELFSMSSDNLSDFRNKNIGFIFQFHFLLPEFTVTENVIMPGLIAQKDRITLEKRAMSLLGDVGLTQRAKHKPNELSGGECQRVAVARALMNTPDVILADEPSGNLDKDNGENLHKIMHRLCEEQGQTFIIATHNSHLASKADRVLHLSGGALQEGKA